MSQPNKELQPIEIAYVTSLNKHAERILAGLYSVSKMFQDLAADLDTKEINDLYSDCHKALKAKVDINKDPKFHHLIEDQIKYYGEKLRYPVNVLRHYMFFQQGALNLLQQAARTSKAFSLSWNYVHVQNIMELYKNYIKCYLFVLDLTQYEKVVTIYNYCYQRRNGVPIDELDKFYFHLINRATPLALVNDLKPLNGHIFPMFKTVASVLERILGPSTSFEWKLLNLSDNPENTYPGDTFFKNEYILMMNLDEIIDWFICFIMIGMPYLLADQQILELLKLVAQQKLLLQLHGDYCIEIRKIYERIRRVIKMQDMDYFNMFSVEFIDKQTKVRDYRRRRLAMALNEAYAGISSDPSLLPLKIPIILSLLGYANFEVTSSFTANQFYDIKKFNTSFLSLFLAIYRLTTFSVKNEAIIKRFIIFNLREYDGPFLNNLINTFHIPQNNYQTIEKFISALQTLDIEKYDNGTKYDLRGLLINIARLMSSFNFYNVSHGVLHLSPLFNMISLLYFHVNLFTNTTEVLLKSMPLHKYWCFTKSFFAISHNFTHDDSYVIPCFLAFAHYYTYDVNTNAEWKGFKGMVMSHVNDILNLASKSISEWARQFQNGFLKDLHDQENIVNINKLQNKVAKPQTDTKQTKNPVKDEHPLLSILVHEESKLENRTVLDPIAKYTGLLCGSMELIYEIGKIKIFGEEYDIQEMVVDRMKELIQSIFSELRPQAPSDLIKTINSAKYILSIILTSANINPHEIIQSSIDQLIYSPLVITDKSVSLDKDKQVGYLTNLYAQHFKKFCREKIHKLVYSSKRKCFILPNVTNSESFASMSSLRDLYKVIGIDGMITVDLAVCETVNEFFDKLNIIVYNEVPRNEKGIPFLNNPSAMQHVDTVIGYITHIGCIMQFRNLLREAVDIDPVINPKYQFMAKDLTPDMDVVLHSKISNNKIVTSLALPLFPVYVGGLLSTAYWAKVQYLPNEDSLSDNSHLIAQCFDAIAGSTLCISKTAPINRIYNNILRNMSNGIKTGNLFHQKNKKVQYPYLTMYIVLDQFVKNSSYADYAMLETTTSYSFIRSVYSILLKNSNNNNNNEQQPQKPQQQQATPQTAQQQPQPAPKQKHHKKKSQKQ